MVKLYRPVGVYELDLILQDGSSGFPKRLPSQPIFYPVLTKEYARDIASKWNTQDKNSGYAGYITSFNMPKEYIDKFEVHTVGNDTHKEIWVNSSDLDKWNRNIIGDILIEEAFYGEQYTGNKKDSVFCKNMDFRQQLKNINQLKNSNEMDYTAAVLYDWDVVTQNYLIWTKMDFDSDGIADTDKCQLLEEIKLLLEKNDKWFFVQ